MKTRNLFFLFLFSLVIIINSCAPAYVPNVVNAPLLTNKGEVQVSLHAGTSGFDPQAAYAITNHLGIMANASFMNSTSDTTNNYHKHGFIEMGAGYFTNFGGRFKFETFAGYGAGKIEAYYENEHWDSYSQADVSRYFIQPSLGITSKVIDFGISARLAFVNLKQGDLSEGALMVEPAATLKFGWDHIKAVAKVGLSVPADKSITFNYQPFMISLGLQGNFGKVFQ